MHHFHAMHPLLIFGIVAFLIWFTNPGKEPK